MLIRLCVILFLFPMVLFSGDASIVVIDWVNQTLKPIAQKHEIHEALGFFNKNRLEKNQYGADDYYKEIVDQFEPVYKAELGVVSINLYGEDQGTIITYPEKAPAESDMLKSVLSDAFSLGAVQITPTFFSNSLSGYAVIAVVPVKGSGGTTGAISVIIDTATFRGN